MSKNKLDLVKLDDYAGVSVSLRRLWRRAHDGKDPVREARRLTEAPEWIMVNLVGLIIAIGFWFRSSPGGWAEYWVFMPLACFGTLGFGLCTLFILFIKIHNLFRKPACYEFAELLEEVVDDWGIPPDTFADWPEEMLRGKATGSLVWRAEAVIRFQRAANELPTENILDTVEGARQEFKKWHCIFFHLDLVEEKWNRFFDLAQAKLKRNDGGEKLPTQNDDPTETRAVEPPANS